MESESRPTPRSISLPTRPVSALLTAVLVARWLVPTESAALGDTLWLTQGTLLLGLIWSLVVAWCDVPRLRWRLSDTAVLLLVAGHVLSALLVVAGTGDKRAAMNLLWEWVSLGMTWFLVRHGVTSRVDRAGLVAALLATVTMLAAFGIWQHYVWYHEQVLSYKTPRDELDELQQHFEPHSPYVAAEIQRLGQKLIELGVPSECLDGPGRKSFESRLLYSREPLAAFALTNSLAGLLLPHLIVALTIVVAPWGQGARWPWFVLGALACGIVAYCLLLTKSRTAYVGLCVGSAIGAVNWMLYRGRTTPDCDLSNAHRNRWFTPVALAGLVVIGLITVAWRTGGLDRLVLDQATKSFQYRLEFWSGTWDMLTAHPKHLLVGVGPGNFRQHYLRFKRPESSEEIADPHQFLMDVWANGGLVGLSGVLLLCWVSVRLLTNRSKIQVQQFDAPKRRSSVSQTVRQMVLAPSMWSGGLATASVLWMTSATETIAIGLMVAWLACAGLWSAVIGVGGTSMIRAFGVGAALASLAVHLLGAGGIGMPAITQVWLIWLALGEAVADGTPQPNPESALLPEETHWHVWGRIGLMATLNLGCLFFATRPVRERRMWDESAMTAMIKNQNPGLAESRWSHAAAADPWSTEPWHRLADLTFRRWLAQPDSAALWDQAIEYHTEVIRRDPFQATAHRTLGNWHLQRYERTHDRRDGAAAELSLTAARELYPNHSGIQAELAESAQAAGNVSSTRTAARRALDLDAINRRANHTDKLLNEPQRMRLQELLDLSRADVNLPEPN
ncbi:MAG: O-antigen ligase family protein [Planctomycetales bacterium]|nr:O-antigen ligase family protein [Planctomycetales bacterium]